MGKGKSGRSKKQKSCSRCRKIPDFSTAHYSGGKGSSDIPKQADGLVVVGAPHFTASTSSSNTRLKKCPTCGTYYQWSFRYEFLVGGSEDDFELIRLSREEGAKKEAEILAIVAAAKRR